MTEAPTVVNDRLYGISMRPQELAVYGESVHFSLRYGPVTEAGDEPVTQHYKLLVLEIHTDIQGSEPTPAGKSRRLQLLKCGWELELGTKEPCPTATLGELQEEVPRLLNKVADTVNDLARRAGLEAPLGPDVVSDLISQYKQGLGISEN